MFYFSILLLVLLGRSNAECGDNLELNLEVTGAYLRANGTIYTVRTNEYATFTCAAKALVKVESKLTVDCDGSDAKTIKKSGAGSANAKYQTNDDCMFNSKCTIKCSAEADCAEKETQEYMLLKSNVGIIDSTYVNCTADINTNKLCTNASYHIHMVKRSEPYGLGGKLSGESSCKVGRHWNTSVINMFYVLPPAKECSCGSTFMFWEMNSKSVLCPDPVYTKIIETRLEEYCEGPGISIGVIVAIILLIIIFILVFLVIVGWMDHRGMLEPLHRWHRAPPPEEPKEDFMDKLKRNVSEISDTVLEITDTVLEFPNYVLTSQNEEPAKPAKAAATGSAAKVEPKK